MHNPNMFAEGNTMAENLDPMKNLVQLEPGGEAPILSYNVPEPTTYSGRNYIEIELDNPDIYFNDLAKQKPQRATSTPIQGLDHDAIKNSVTLGMKSGFLDASLFPNIQVTGVPLKFVEKTNPGLSIEDPTRVSPRLAHLDPDEVAYAMEAGKRLNIYQSMSGKLTYNYLPVPVFRPRLLLIEEYRMSSFLGSYGAGKVIKTFTLLPGEKTRISIKTYTKTESESKSASSILDSFTDESADEFESTLQSEQTNKQSSSESSEYHAEAEAKASWGWGSAKVSGGVKGGSNSAREDFSKNVSGSVEKHANKASAKRDVQVNTSFEVKQETGEETSIEREIQNVNVSRTLNFVFRQMNQEFITLLHLVDVRIAFFNGFAESKFEVTLPNIDRLIEKYIMDDAAKRKEVKDSILSQLQEIYDYKDQKQSLIEEFGGTDKYWRVMKNIVSTYIHPVTKTKKDVPGILISATTNVMRTDGVIVEALLGVGDALDEYSHGLQDEAVRAKILSNDLLEAEIERNNLGIKIVSENDKEKAELFKQVFPTEAKLLESAFSVVKLKDKTDGGD